MTVSPTRWRSTHASRCYGRATISDIRALRPRSSGSDEPPGPCVCGLSSYVDAPRTPSGLAKSSSCRWDDSPVKRARSALSGRLSSLGRCQLAAAHHASVLLRSSAVPLPGRCSSLLSQRLEPRVSGTIGGATRSVRLRSVVKVGASAPTSSLLEFSIHVPLRVSGAPIGGALDPAPCQRSSQEWASG